MKHGHAFPKLGNLVLSGLTISGLLPIYGTGLAEELANRGTTTNAFQDTPLPQGITSFGAAIIDDTLYVYGGHKGRAHHYYKSGQVNELSKLDLDRPAPWKVIAKGPHLQGLAMVAHGGTLIRVGGFTAHNEEDEKHDLRSIPDVARFDPKLQQWQSLTPLPEPRSSHDAVVVGDNLYVAGGWQLNGTEGDQRWHTTAWVADLSQPELVWQPLPEPPFQRRALSLGSLDGKLYVIGGMQQRGGPTTRVDVFDPTLDQWSRGSSLIDPQAEADSGAGMEGFGTSAFALGDRLFVSTYGGNLQYLGVGDRQWQTAKLKDDRFFHRMLPYGQKLLLVGGASMEAGKRLLFEVVDVESL